MSGMVKIFIIKTAIEIGLGAKNAPSGNFNFFWNYNTEFEEVVFSKLSEAINRLLFMSSKS